MSPDDLRATVTGLGLLLLGVGFAVAAIPLGCDSCPHCRRQRLENAAICPLHKIPRHTCERYHKE